MSGTIIDNDTMRRKGITLQIGKSYITADQSVTKIVEEHSKLQEDGQTIETRYVGDNHIEYKADQNGQPQATDGQKDILLEIGGHIDQQAVTDALNHVTQAERVLNPLGLAVIVKQSQNSEELQQA